jgi:hypothetical protein
MHRAGGRALAALAMRALAGGEPALAAASTSARALLARAPAAATTTLLHSTTSREWPAPAARTFSSSAPDPPPSPAAKNHTGWGQTKVQELLDFKVRGGKRNKKCERVGLCRMLARNAPSESISPSSSPPRARRATRHSRARPHHQHSPGQ